MPNRATVAVCLVLAFAHDARAWGLKGHRIVASAAEKRLKAEHPGAWKKISELLGPGITLASIATCADSIRDYVRKPADTALPPGCLLSADEATTRFPDTASWHFVNIPVPAPSRSRAVLEAACPAEKPCILARIDAFRKQLSDRRASKRDRAIAVLFLTHLVADLHQPLHAVQRNGDAGGNNIVVSLGGQSSRLHSLWDTNFVEPLQEIEIGGRVSRKNKTPESWAWESYDAAENVAYHGIPTQPGTFEKPIVITDPNYRARATEVIKQRLYAASVRLAALLADAVGD